MASSNPFVAVFDDFCKSSALTHDLALDEALNSAISNHFHFNSHGESDESSRHEEKADSLAPVTALRDFFVSRLEYQNTQFGVSGVDLCVLILRAFVVTANDQRVQRARVKKIHSVIEGLFADTEIIDDLKLDFPKIEDALVGVRNSFPISPRSDPILKPASTTTTAESSKYFRRPRILAVRSGFNPHGDVAKRIRQFAELRVPLSPLVWETGIEDPGGAGGDETRNILRAHLAKRRPLYEEDEPHLTNENSDIGKNEQCLQHLRGRRPFYDLLLTNSRGSVYLEKLWGEDEESQQKIDTEEISEKIPVLVLSPPGEIGRDLLATAEKRRERILVAYAGNDISGEAAAKHPVVDIEQVKDLIAKYENVHFERELFGNWADGIATLTQKMRSLGHLSSGSEY